MADTAPLSLCDREPHVPADRLVAEMVPPPRFDSVRFDTYIPDPNQPSQTEAVRVLAGFAAGLSGAHGVGGGKRGFLGLGKAFGKGKEAKTPAGPRGVYLDGGYGVGKTHLLASLWHATPAEPSLKAFGTFVELTNLVGALGFQKTVQTLSGHRLLCIDEFELDDPGDTVLVSTLLGSWSTRAWRSPPPPTPCRASSARAGSRPPTSCARSRSSPPASAPCASTARTTATAGCPRRRRRSPTRRSARRRTPPRAPRSTTSRACWRISPRSTRAGTAP